LRQAQLVTQDGIFLLHFLHLLLYTPHISLHDGKLAELGAK
jgi:hypothetical protein